jgi:electron transfer flavoprotein alpha subunit
MRVAVLVKQIPQAEQLMIVDGRLVRDGVPLEVNAYCRRANAKAVELAGQEGEVVVFTMGPPSAADALREMLACGAHRAVHLCDPMFAGSDTLATARALAAAIRAEGPFDLVLCGLNSLDADTGQVGPQVAELLGLPFCAGARTLDLGDGSFAARLEDDGSIRAVTGPLPAVIAAAERLCDPSKAGPEERAAIHGDRIRTVGQADLGLAPHAVGQAGSPTSVGVVREVRRQRAPRRTSDPAEAARWVTERQLVPDPPRESVPEPSFGRRQVWCVVEPGGRGAAELLGEAAVLAAAVGATVTAFVGGEAPPGLAALGADQAIVVPGRPEPEQLADALAAAAALHRPWAVLVEGTQRGRCVASSVAARHGWGLTGDAVAFEIEGDRLLAWKPTCGGQSLVAIGCRSEVQLATVRRGVLPVRQPRKGRDLPATVLDAPTPARLATVDVESTDPDLARFLAAPAVVVVGRGVDPADYPRLDLLRRALADAPLGATRKVTDAGWLPRSRQIGITGHAISPRLLVSVGASGRFNHAVGFRNAGTVLAVNADPEAPIFDLCDIGLVADWRDVVDVLAASLATGPQAALA